MAFSPNQVREEPRISVNDLALFMVSSDTARFGIIKRAKYQQVPPITRYKDVRQVACRYFFADRCAHTVFVAYDWLMVAVKLSDEMIRLFQIERNER